MKYLIILLFLFSCTSKVKCIRVKDGDTIVLENKEVIRLAEIDAPELHQDYGIQAKQFLSYLVLNKIIEVKRTGKDMYGRTLARLYSNGLYINEYMVISGEAWSYRYHGKIYNEQLKARRNKIGLWQFNDPEPPYLFRKKFN